MKFSIVLGQKMNFLKLRNEKKEKLLIKFRDKNNILPFGETNFLLSFAIERIRKQMVRDI